MMSRVFYLPQGRGNEVEVVVTETSGGGVGERRESRIPTICQDAGANARAEASAGPLSLVTRVFCGAPLGRRCPASAGRANGWTGRRIPGQMKKTRSQYP